MKAAVGIRRCSTAVENGVNQHAPSRVLDVRLIGVLARSRGSGRPSATTRTAAGAGLRISVGSRKVGYVSPDEGSVASALGGRRVGQAPGIEVRDQVGLGLIRNLRWVDRIPHQGTVDRRIPLADRHAERQKRDLTSRSGASPSSGTWANPSKRICVLPSGFVATITTSRSSLATTPGERCC